MLKLARSLHLPARMFSSHLRIAPALGAGLLFASFASAQEAGTNGENDATGAMQATPISIGDREFDTMQELRLGITDCERDVAVLFQLDNIDPDKPTIDIYEGSDCNEQTRTDETDNDCNYVTSQSTDGKTQDLEVMFMARGLFGGDCDMTMESHLTLWFLAVDSRQSGEDVGDRFDTHEIEVDSEAPDAPTNVEGGSGERMIRVDWDTDETDLERFIIYIDETPTSGDSGTGGGADEDGGTPSSGSTDGGTGRGSSGDCGSDLLVPGADPSELPDGVRTVRVNNETATGKDLTPAEIGGNRAAVAVVAVDLAGNESLLSELACVSVMPTDGFWDVYEASGGEDVSGCPCTTLGPAQVQSAWPVALSLLFLARSARRKRQS